MSPASRRLRDEHGGASPVLHGLRMACSRAVVVVRGLRDERGSAVAGWVLVVPLVLGVALMGAEVVQMAFAGIRVHTTAVRVAYTLGAAVGSGMDTAGVQQLATRLAGGACARAHARWVEESVAGVPMVKVSLACEVRTAVGGARAVTAQAHAPVERP